MRAVFVVLVLASAACGCAAAPELVVTVKTDFAPQLELGSVRTVLHDAASQTATRDVVATDAFLDGVRVASFPTSNGSTSLTVELLDVAGGVLASRDVRVDVHGSTAVTVLITRTCATVHCPGPSDPGDATSCEAGRCVSATCTSGCTAAECSAAADCTGITSMCVAPRCDHGTCLYTPTGLPGCAMFCPEAATLRQQMAVFIVRLMHGTTFVPPPATGTFTDVPTSSSFAPYVEQMARDGITAGCGASMFCPTAELPRSEAAVFLVRATHGATFRPPSARGTFTDVPTTAWYADYVEQLVHDHIAVGCSATRFCPDEPLLRRQAAVYFLKAEHGASYLPPPTTGTFVDVPMSLAEAPWIERFVAEGFATGCAI